MAMLDAQPVISLQAQQDIDVSKTVAQASQAKQRDSNKTLPVTFEDYQAVSNIVFEWADSYDNKDWPRLAKILAPHLLIDYSIVGHERADHVTAADFLEMMSSPMFLGDPLIRTQHLMGASRYEKTSETEIIGHHQIRAAHQRYKADGVTVENRGHGHSFVMHWYSKVDGEWKLSGLKPEVYWNEHDFDKIFVQLKAKH